MQIILSLIKPILIKLATKELIVKLVEFAIDLAVKSSKTNVDDALWADIKPIIEKL